jgi:hypothetical protein
MGKQRILFSLTPYGQQQVRDNIRLSHLMARKFLPPYGMGIEDWQAECHMVLCQAVAWHSPEKGALSTLMERLVFLRRSNLNGQWKAKRASRDLRALSLDEERGEEGGSMMLGLGVEDDGQAQLENREQVDAVYAHLTARGKKICDLIRQGFGICDIGRELGFTKQYASQSLRAERAKLVQIFPHLVSDSGKQCVECGGVVIVCKNGARPSRCPPCAAARETKVKSESWRRQSRRRSELRKAFNKGGLSNV